MKPTRPLLTRRTAHRVMPLEARLMFDAAAATEAAMATATADAAATDATRTVTAAPAVAEPSDTRSVSLANPGVLAPAQQQASAAAIEQVNATLSKLPAAANFAELLKQSFGSAGTDPELFAQRAAELARQLGAGDLRLQVELRSGADLQGAYAAYAARGADGQERIYLNADWLARGASEQDIARVLLEEAGHAIDQRLNAGADSAGDEGERFSALVRGETQNDFRLQALQADADQMSLMIDGHQVDVEFSELSVPFPEGFIGTVGTSSNKANGILNFSTLGITRASFFQDSSSGSFTTQGNDIPGGIRLTLTSGQVITVNGAINWRVTQGSTLYAFGFIPDPSTQSISFSYGSGQTFTISATSNFALELVGVTYSETDNTNVTGNAATSGLLTALNTYLTQVQANDPTGPVTVTTQTTADTTPTLGGSVTLAGGESLSVIVNGVTYTTSNGLSVGGGTWSLTIPDGNALTAGTTYSVTATITNGAGYTLTDSSLNELVITAPDVTAPVVAASQSFSYAENQSSGTVLGTVSASDAVGVTGFRFSATSTATSADGYYSIDSSGQISLTTAGAAAGVATNDYETSPNSFTYGVQARDAAGNWSSAVNVSLNVTDMDDTAPVVAASQSFSYAENQSSGTVLGTVSASDAVGVTGFRFSATSTTTSADGYYSINSSGQISLTTAGAAAGVATNDYETSPNSFTYGIQARDAAGNWSSAVNVTLNVTDMDDTAPVVAASQSFSYAENQSSGTVLGTVSASDAVGVTGYRFSATSTSTSADGYYSIDSSGQISLTTAGAAAGVATNDYETSPNSFTYGIQARDAAGNWSSAVNVTLNVTDMDDTAPVVAASQSFSYAENQSSGTTLGTVSASDAVGVTGYRFSATSTSTSADGYYSIDSSGQISLTTAGAAAGVATNDYETSPNSFTYGIQARDAAGNWSSAVNVSLNVTDVDDTAPVVAASQSFSYAENQSSGAVLGTVSASDAVGVTGFRFSATSTATSADGYYSIDSSGQISLTTAGAAAGVATNDYETTPNSFTYGIEAGDAAGNWSSAVNVTLNVSDVDDTAPVVAASQSFSYAENQSSGAMLGTASASDAVGVTGYRFSATGTSTSADGYYSIDSTGQISLTTAGAAAGVATNDYETTPNSFTYGIEAGDAAGNWSSTVNVTLNITDVNEASGDSTAPVVAASQSFSYTENQSSGAVLGTVSASDAVGVTDYRFSATSTSTSADGYYSINSSGQISLTTAGAAAGVATNDYEVGPNSFTYGIQAGDAAGNWSSAVNVSLNVTDADDTAPVVASSQSFSYAENQSSGAVLGTVSANDAVGVTDYRFSATSTTTSADGYYSIGSSGQISLTTAGAAAGIATNDYEVSPNSFTYGIQAGDAAGNWSSAVNVTLNVTDMDDTAPVVAASQSFSYAENQSSGAVLGTVSASDAVGVTGYRFSATSTSTSADGYYSIDSSGQISLTTAGATAGVATNDYETTPNSFAYGIQARDAAANWSPAVNVTLTVTDVNEASGDSTAPVVSTGQSFSYAENQSSGAVLGTVSANDAVGVTGFRFSATNTGTSTDGYYSIDSSGQISLTTAGAAAGVAANDYETTPNSFTYGVQARDAAGNWSSAVNVSLNVTDVDDTAPVVAASQSFSYAENQSSGAVLGTVSASDAVGVTGYRFSATGTSTSADGYYNIDGSGQISLTTAGATAGVATNDYETTPNSFTYGIEAGDAAGNWSPAVNVTLNVTDVNEASGDSTAPVVSTGQSFSYAENQSSGAVLGTVSASDDIGVTDYRFSATGTSTSADGYYSINSSGQIALTTAGAAAGAATNDYETTPNSFIYGVQARDAAGHWSSAVNVTLAVTNAAETAPDTAQAIEGAPITGNVLANDAALGGHVASFTVGSQSASAGGTLVIDGVGTITIAANGQFRFDPVANWHGTVPTITYMTDSGPSATLQLSITPSNEAPTLPPVVEAPPPAAPVLPATAAPVATEVPLPAIEPHAFDSALRTADARPESPIVVTRVQSSPADGAQPVVARESNVADIYTRPSGFQIMVNPSPEPSLRLFRGLDDQVVTIGATVQLQVPADTFVHSVVNETVTLQASLADGRPLPRWLHFDSRSGALTGDVPADWRDDLAIRIIARDSQGREATAMMRLKLSTGRASGAGLSHQLMHGRAVPLAARALAQRAPAGA